MCHRPTIDCLQHLTFCRLKDTVRYIITIVLYCYYVCVVWQAVKQKLHIKPHLQLADALLPKLAGRDPEADKAKLLMGDTLTVCHHSASY